MNQTKSDTKIVRGTLIQRFDGFEGQLQPHLSVAYSLYNIKTEYDRLQALQWIIREAAYRVHHLVERNHYRVMVYEQIYNYLNGQLDFDVLQCVNHYFIFPRLFGDDTEVSIRLQPLGLFIDYYSEPIQRIF